MIIKTLASGLARKSPLELVQIGAMIMIPIYFLFGGIATWVETSESVARQAAERAAETAIEPITPARVATATPAQE